MGRLKADRNEDRKTMEHIQAPSANYQYALAVAIAEQLRQLLPVSSMSCKNDGKGRTDGVAMQQVETPFADYPDAVTIAEELRQLLPVSSMSLLDGAEPLKVSGTSSICFRSLVYEVV